MDIFRETLVTGAAGMVGEYVDFGVKLSHAELDITDPESIARACDRYRPKTILHLAAETDVDRCEREPAHGYFVNSIGTWNIARAAKKIGAKVIYVSTVYVFNGSKGAPYDENDFPMPLGAYGRSKHLGEILLRETTDDHLIVRPGWMFGGGPGKDKKFVSKIIGQLDQPEIKAVNDTFGSLTYAKDLVAKIKDLMTSAGTAKLIHVSNSGFCSRYDIAQLISRIMQSSAIVTPVSSSYFPGGAMRSRSDCMNSKQNGTMRPWQEALTEYLKHEWTPDTK